MTWDAQAVERGSRQIAEQVGMMRIGSGEDPEVMQLATDLGFSRTDVANRPSVVASAITGYLDDLVRNP
jgi:hypothetical protein